MQDHAFNHGFNEHEINPRCIGGFSEYHRIDGAAENPKLTNS
jgi:hypothetical protein